MNITTISTPLHPAPMRAVKSPPLHFAGKSLTGVEGKSKQGRFKFSIFKLMMLTGAVASGLAMKTHNDQLERQQIALDTQYRKQDELLNAYYDFSLYSRLNENIQVFSSPPSSWAFIASHHELDQMGWSSTKGKDIPWDHPSKSFIYPQHDDALFSIKADESFLKSSNYPLRQADLKTLYQRYLTRPDSNLALEFSRKADSQLKTSPETIKALKVKYSEYAKAVNGKQNPISLDEFSLMVDIYHFFSHLMAGNGDKEAPKVLFQQYLETVLTQHTQNPKLPFVKPYYEKAKADLTKLVQAEKEIQRFNLKRGFIKTADAILLLAFGIGLAVPRKSKIQRGANP